MKKPIQIFKPGKHVASNGAELDFSESQLSASAAAYDPAKHEAPIVVGHPQHDAPAYGWVKTLSFADGLDAEPHQVDPAFAEMVARGAFKKISASFYTPDSPSNPVPGVYYLRHVGFLGAQPPAVKGLRNPEFADAEEGVIDFADWGDVQNASLWRQLKNWLIGEKGTEVADKVIPEYSIAMLEDEARKEDEGKAVASQQFTETQTQGDEMSEQDKARLATLETENAKFKKDQADFAETQAKVKRDARHAGHVSFADGLVKAGKLLPAHKEVTVATLDFMANQESVVEFGEGDARKPLLDTFKTQLEGLPKIVEFGELSGTEKDAAAGVVNFAAPAGYSVDTARLDIHRKAVAHQAQHSVSYEVALAAVNK